MSKFNQKQVSKNETKNLAGGSAYKLTTKSEIASMIMTSLLQNQYYESDKDRILRLQKLFEDLEDKKFIAKASLYARNEHGLRSISHLCTGIISKLSGLPWLSSYYEKVVRRVDDMSEIISYIYSEQDKLKEKHKLPSSLKKGFAKAFSKFDGYQLSKYQNNNRAVKLLDIVNLVHPVPTEKNADALKKLMNKELKQTETWNAKMVEATKNIQADTVEEKEQLKKEAKKNVWKEFLDKDNKVEYFALLKNLRNIAETNDQSLIDKACSLLTDEYKIKQSKVLPFRYLTALKNIPAKREYTIALSKAIEICLNNVPRFKGKTLIALDVSGSMRSGISYFNDKASVSMLEIGQLFTSALYKTSDCDVVTYTTSAEYRNDLNPMDSLFTIASKLGVANGGTNANSVFDLITNKNKKYDRIILLSDMQSWGQDYGNSTWWGCEGPQGKCKDYWNKYRKEVNPECKLYSFDLTGNGTSLFPEKSTFNLAGISDKIFDIMAKLDENQNAFIDEIENVVL